MSSKQNFTGDKDFDEILQKAIDTLNIKSKDYTIGNSDKLHNFKTVSNFTGVKNEVVWSVYFYKHISAIMNYVKSNGKSESEPIEGRIVDCINYLLLFYKMIKEKEAKHTASLTIVGPIETNNDW